MNQPPSLRDIRHELIDALRVDLVGPCTKDELLTQAPRQLYAVGRLAPERTRKHSSNKSEAMSADPNDIGEVTDYDSAAADVATAELFSDQNDENGDIIGEPVRRDALAPSSIGLSCMVADHVDSLSISVRWGDYEKVEREEGKIQWLRHERASELHGVPVRGHDSTLSISLTRSRAAARGMELIGHEDDSIALHWIMRRIGKRCAFSVFLINKRLWTRDADDERWIFQPEIRIHTRGSNAAFVARDIVEVQNGESDDPDVIANSMLYRHVHEFAVGHGVSAEWCISELNPERADEVFTEFLPLHEIPRFEPAMIDGAVYDMKVLAEVASAIDIAPMLLPIVDEYKRWIDDREHDLSALSDSLRQVANCHISLCRESADRLAEGIRLIESNRIAFEAFQFANRVMWDQRVRGVQADARRKGKVVPPLGAVDLAENRSWRPFQLAFILMVLPGMIDERHPARSLVDLLWFPTGGGKTEAYLGLTAFVLAFRRLRGDLHGLRSEAGVTVIMRYTLRLLTIQQFQRASAMILACEVERRKNSEKWGNEPFSIGLWVGDNTTPNTYDDACSRIVENKKVRRFVKGTPVQILSCPRCGSSLVEEDGRPIKDLYKTDDTRRRIRIYCPSVDCEFHISAEPSPAASAMPIVVVDEEIYRVLPSLLVATVDKFAQIPFKGEACALFGHRNRYSSTFGHLTEAHGREVGKRVVKDAEPAARLVPPELIIQDELHLISGPLGTMVGLYESIINRATSIPVGDTDYVIPAKIIASTATIRRADRQVRSLYNRNLRVFPQSGLTAHDSFFARERPIDPAVDASAGRLYVGICAPGVSSKMLLVRTYAVFLAAAQQALEKYGSIADPYMTLVGYFNSLRALGGALRLVEDNVDLTRLKYLHEQRNFPRRYVNKTREMTSRAGSVQIPGLLKALEQPFPREGPGTTMPIDVLLATNMISVGVDIDRLGLMVVAGQPKSSSEYIQATSRVGRKYPGLVAIVYNWPAPRDISHFEHFVSYHQSMYQHVEAVSATPFSPRAVDRGLNGLLAGLVRATIPGMSAERDAEKFDADDEFVQDVLAYLVNRAEAVSGKASAKYLQENIAQRGSQWTVFKQELLRYCWHSAYLPTPNNERVLLKFSGSSALAKWDAPGSLRGVEPTAAFFIKG